MLNYIHNISFSLQSHPRGLPYCPKKDPFEKVYSLTKNILQYEFLKEYICDSIVCYHSITQWRFYGFIMLCELAELVKVDAVQLVRVRIRDILNSVLVDLLTTESEKLIFCPNQTCWASMFRKNEMTEEYTMDQLKADLGTMFDAFKQNRSFDGYPHAVQQQIQKMSEKDYLAFDLQLPEFDLWMATQNQMFKFHAGLADLTEKRQIVKCECGDKWLMPLLGESFEAWKVRVPFEQTGVIVAESSIYEDMKAYRDYTLLVEFERYVTSPKYAKSDDLKDRMEIMHQRFVMMHELDDGNGRVQIQAEKLQKLCVEYYRTMCTRYVVVNSMFTLLTS